MPTNEQLPTSPRLDRDPDGLFLDVDGVILRGDLTRMLPRLKPANLASEMLVKAARIKGFQGTPTVVDATAGLGEDSLLLAAAGFRVLLFERDPMIAELLADSLERAAADAVLAPLAGRMELVRGDSIQGLLAMADDPDSWPDVVYLDPMFPGRTKSAAVKKKFQMLHHLERPCEDEDQLMRAAMAAHPRKIVVKRPAKAPVLAGIKPSHSISGKAIRYDCIVLPR